MIEESKSEDICYVLSTCESIAKKNKGIDLLETEILFIVFVERYCEWFM